MPDYDVLIRRQPHWIESHFEISPGVEDTMTKRERLVWLFNHYMDVDLTPFQLAQLRQYVYQFTNKTLAELKAMAVEDREVFIAIVKAKFAEKFNRVYTVGDIIKVYPGLWLGDGTETASDGRPTRGFDKNTFYVLHVKNCPLTLEAISAYSRRLEEDSGETEDNGDPIPRVLKRREWYLDIDSLPASVRNALNSTGQYSPTWSQVVSYVERKT